MTKIRNYPHFDTTLNNIEALALTSNPSLIAKHAFHPFIEYSDAWTKFAAKGLKGKVKSRPIKYASRRDSCIYSHYRTLLINAYEQELFKRGISHVVLAYRRIPRLNAKGNKSNIHFADDVFSDISQMGNCLVYTLDISKFFESLEHDRVKQNWIKVMGFKTLPSDHYQVFRNITRYATVNRETLYRELNFIGMKQSGTRQIMGYLVKRIPLQVCSGATFRKKIAPLIKTNLQPYGIPQGSPISDVLANLYMLDFDTQMVAFMSKCGGSYRRYSDDILLIVPGHNDDCRKRWESIEHILASCCGQILKLQNTKSTVHKFTQSEATKSQSCEHIEGSSGKNGLEYLGFRFDGKRVFIRDSTRSRLQRKMTYAVNAAVRKLYSANSTKGRAELKKLFEPNKILHQFYKIRDFENKVMTPKSWTFWTYAIRAQQVFGDKGKSIARQLRNFRRSILHKAEKSIDKVTKQA
ncbi:MAG: reverse transcriptase domain-containing protein [Acidobacteriaceae bacterium]|nr:reverse transcriptase domain-containing protein [Acidobacteriaceae bacterium]